VVVLYAAAALSCAHHTVFDRIKNGDFSMVSQGRYDHPARFLDEGREYHSSILKIRTVIEKYFDLMPLITEQYYTVEYDLVFTYKYALLDTMRHSVVLRYFARTHNDPVLAGYQIFFVYDTIAKEIIEIFTNEVPLE